jgi:hypothetical protein
VKFRVYPQNVEIELVENSIASALPRQTCDHCGQDNCCYECDGSTASIQDAKSELQGTFECDVRDRLFANGFTDGVESLLVALYPLIRNANPAKIADAVTTAMEGADNSG